MCHCFVSYCVDHNVYICCDHITVAQIRMWNACHRYKMRHTFLSKVVAVSVQLFIVPRFRTFAAVCIHRANAWRNINNNLEQLIQFKSKCLIESLDRKVSLFSMEVPTCTQQIVSSKIVGSNGMVPLRFASIHKSKYRVVTIETHGMASNTSERTRIALTIIK